jgi:OmpA-OmpF porin, OOP family
MSDSPSSDERRGAVRRPTRQGGARAVGGSAAPSRRRRLLPLLVGLAALALIGILLVVLLSDGSSKKNNAAAGATTNTNANASRTTNNAAAGSTDATTNTSAGAGSDGQGADGSNSTGTLAALPPAGLIGGGGVPARPARGALAPAGAAGAILFTEAGTALDRHARAVVAMAAKEIKAPHAHAVNVIGYTDKLGNKPANVALSLQRTKVVVAALRRQLSGSTVRFHTQAQGETHPVAENSTAQGRQLNRRVVIFIKH